MDTRGKHRISTELKRLEQEIRFLEEELEQLEKMESASSACKEMLINIETRPDPLLPETTGPIIRFGTDGLKDHKSLQGAGAGFYDGCISSLETFFFRVDIRR